MGQKIIYYHTDGGGNYTIKRKEKYIKGSKEKAISMVENTRSPWGYNYVVAHSLDNNYNAFAIIVEVPRKVVIIQNKITRLENKITKLTDRMTAKYRREP